MVRNEEGEITSNRKRDTTNQKAGCEWRVYLSYKDWPHRGTGIKKWQLTVQDLQHQAHELLDNPLSLPSHRNRLDEVKQLKQLAVTHRLAVIPYKESRRVLEAEGFGVVLTSQEYYNTVRKAPFDKTDPKSLVGLLQALNEAGFIYQSRLRDAISNDDSEISRTLEQIWFSHPELIQTSKRFVSDALLVIDGTFNTNNLRMPLLVAVGVLNSGRTFPVAFSFTRSESSQSYEFFLESFKHYCCSNENQGLEEAGAVPAVGPAVVLGDWTGGIAAAVPKVFPQAKVQGCDWHAVEAMKARFRQSKGYSAQEIDGYQLQDGSRAEGLTGLCWKWVKSVDTEQLRLNETALLAALQPSEKDYFKYWQSREQRVVYAHTRFNANMGSTSSQRGESYHPVIREVTNSQLPLSMAVQRLVDTVKLIIRSIAGDESEALRRRLTLSQSPLYQQLQFKVSLLAIRLLGQELAEVEQLVRSAKELGPCNCETLYRYRISCKHTLRQFYLSGDPLPRSLFHPRWWVNGPAIYSSNWQPTWPDSGAIPQPISMSSTTSQVADIYSKLQPTEKVRFDQQMTLLRQTTSERALQIGQDLLALQDVPVRLPDPIPRRRFIQKKTHGKADARALTAAELSHREQLDREKQDSAQTPSKPPPTPPPPPTVLVIRSPETVQRRGLSPTPDIPSSTAPATLESEKGRGKRKRRTTERYNEAVDKGLIQANRRLHQHHVDVRSGIDIDGGE